MAVVDFDVAIVGYGPVGQTLATLLGKAGHRVGVFERYHDFYPLPRAVRFDGEVMRIFQNIGIVEDIEDAVMPADHYLWYGANRNLLVDIDLSAPAPAGWHNSYVFYQPYLEAALDRAAHSWPNVMVERGWKAERLEQHDDHVELTLRQAKRVEGGGLKYTDETRVVRTRYLVGADGAKSFVREGSGIPWIDMGFAEKWAVIDVQPHNINDFKHLPGAAQYCDPVRPITVVANGKHCRRWEFMLLAGERPEDFTDNPARIWQLLEPYIKPEQGELVRYAVYEFRSLIAETMRVGRVLIAGDAAHLMPPFMGEGMCSGLRDANNLAWKLDFVLRGSASEDLLETYTTERRVQNQVTVAISMEMGRVSCVLDPVAAAARDEAFLSGKVPPPPSLPGLANGLLHRTRTGEKDPLAGQQAVQGRVEGPRGTGMVDDVIGGGFAVVCMAGNPQQELGRERMEFLNSINAHVITLDPAIAGAVRDVDGALSSWLTKNGLVAAINRPDFYVFGGASSIEELPALVDDLKGQLTAQAVVV